MSSLSVSVHSAIAEVPREKWNALLTSEDSPFVDWRFLSALEHSGCAVPDTGWTACHFAVHRKKELVAVAPAYIKEGSDGDFSRDWDWAGAAERSSLPYYPKLLLGIPFTPVTGRRVLMPADLSCAESQETLGVIVAAAQQLMKEYGLGALQVLFPTAEQQAGFVAHGLYGRIDFQYHFVNPGYERTDDFYGRFSSKRRNMLRREMAAPASQGVTIRTLRQPELKTDLAHYARLAHMLHRSTVDKLLWGRRWLNQEFYSQLFSTMPEGIELVLAERAGAVIAGAFNIAGAGRLFGRYWGCLEELPFLHFNVCLYHSIAECIERGTSVFEGGAGGEHKIARGFEPIETYSAHAFLHPRLAAALAQHLRSETENRRQAIATWREQESVLKPWPTAAAR